MSDLTLIGQYDSPFVRRVGIALRLYDIPFTHWPWSVFGDADRLRKINPLVRVPTLITGDGTVLTDSTIILDYLDSRVPADRALVPRAEPARHRALRIVALACGLGDKAVSLFYERRLHDQVSDLWVARCKGQIDGVLARLESDLNGPWYGETMGHADIAVACVMGFVTEAHPGIVDRSTLPRLSELCDRLEALPVFREISQPFAAPA